MTNPNQFSGFTPLALEFLRDIRLNNSKRWYEEHKDTYRRLLLTPFQALVCDLSGPMLAIDPYFITTPAIDKTISRIYRDTRFSKDKSLYRDSMWLTFKRPSPDWKEAPAYFFEVTPEGYRYGMGFYAASKSYMDRFRERIKAKPGRFLETVAFLKGDNPFERYQRRRGEELPAELRDWFQYKSFSLISSHQMDRVLFSNELVRHLIAGFKMLGPLYQYLWEVIE